MDSVESYSRGVVHPKWLVVNGVWWLGEAAGSVSLQTGVQKYKLLSKVLLACHISTFFVLNIPAGVSMLQYGKK